MSAYMKRRSNNNKISRRQQQLNAAAATAAMEETSAAAEEATTTTLLQEQLSPSSTTTAATSITTTTTSTTADDEALEMPRICRCCCKRDVELLSLYESPTATHEEETETEAPLRRRRQRRSSSDNPVDYALNGARSGMDIVLEEMHIWKLNICCDDGLPQELCRQCKAQFLMIAKFRRKCVRMQKRLLDFAMKMEERKATIEAATEATMAEKQTASDEAKERPSYTDCFSRNCGVDMTVESEPPEKLMQTPQEAIPTATPTADYVHLPEERSQRLREKREKSGEQRQSKSKLRRFQLRLRRLSILNQKSNNAKPKTEQATQEIGKDSPKRTLKSPWKTKAARKLIIEPLPRNTEKEVRASPETHSELSVESLRGFESDDNHRPQLPSDSALVYPKSEAAKRESPKSKAVGVLRRGRRPRSVPNYLPIKRRRTVLRKKQEEPAVTPIIESIEEPRAPPAQQQLQFEELTSSTPTCDLQSLVECQSQTPEAPSPQCEVEICPSSAESSPFMRMELEMSQAQVSSTAEQEQPAEEEEELIVSIPLDVLSEELREKLQYPEQAMDMELEEQKETTPAVDDLNNNENQEGEHFRQSAAAVSFNSAAALEAKQIEATTQITEAAMEEPLQVAKTPPKIEEYAEPVDFFAEFQKQCEKSLDESLASPPQLSEAKRQLEVEMNDVETTLNGILNEMQDQHIYTPVCPNVDEFLTPADYAPLHTSPEEEEQPVAKSPQQHSSANADLFDMPGYEVFSPVRSQAELIGFQNDLPSFENIEANRAATEAHSKLQLELTQLLNELQPTTEQQQPATIYEPAATTGNGNYYQRQPQPPPQLPHYGQQQQQLVPQQTQLQWSAVGGLEAIKTNTEQQQLPSNSGSTTYYLSASDLYQPQQPAANFASLQQQQASPLLDSNENYLEQQQPIMILIQQPELAQPVASASNPHQAPLHIYGAPISNELHQQQQQQQQQQQLQLQQVQKQSVLSLNNNINGNVSNRIVTLKCRFCHNGPRFSSSLEYSKHIIELHPAIAPFNCPHCPLAFAGRNKRSQHILTHHFVQRYQCGQCTQVFPAQRALDLHLQRYHALNHDQQQQQSLSIAGVGGPGGGGVRVEEVQLQLAEQQHQQTALVDPREMKPRKTRILCCPDCEDCTVGGQPHVQYEETPLTSTIASLPSPEQSEPDSTTTLRQFRKRRSSPCALMMAAPLTPTPSLAATSPSPSSSPSSTSNSLELINVSSLPSLRGSHQCSYCEERFTNDIALRKHNQLAHGTQTTTMPFVCSICKRGYRMRTALQRHMETHDASGRPYECNLCRVRFPRPSQLTLHKITVHLLSKPHTCDECGKQFGTESALKTHIKFHGERGYACDQCDRAFACQRDLRKHRRTHSDELFYKCDCCPRSFLHYTSYRAHMNSHLPLGVFLTEEANMLPTAGKDQVAIGLDVAAVDEMALTPLSSSSGGDRQSPPMTQLVESSAVAATPP